MTSTSDRILVIGESLIDRVSSADAEVEHVGGSPANVALGLGRLGYPVTLLTQFGSDRRGTLIREHLQGDVGLVQGGDPSIPTSTALVTMDGQGIPSYVFDLAWDVDFPEIASPSVVHTGSLGAYLEPGRSEVVRIIRQHASNATVTFDPNLRPLIMDRDTAAARVHNLVELANVVKVSDEDLAWLHPGIAPESIAAGWVEAGVELVALTRGSKGAEAWSSRAYARVSARSVNVVDTVGAGDAFMSGLIDALCTINAVGPDRTSELKNLSEKQLHAILAHATSAAGIAVAHAGAHPPTRTELGWCGQR